MMTYIVPSNLWAHIGFQDGFSPIISEASLAAQVSQAAGTSRLAAIPLPLHQIPWMKADTTHTWCTNLLNIHHQSSQMSQSG
jgi:hypothetical protein